MTTRLFHTSRRVLQLRDIPTSNTLPKVNGRGPFPDVPNFRVLDGNMLHLTVPASSSVYTRRGTIIGVIDGEINNVQSRLGTDQSAVQMARSMPLLYQQVTSTTPVSLLVGTQQPNTTYAVLPVQDGYDWIVAQRKALLGWTGNAQVEPYSHFKSWGNIKVGSSANNDQLVLAGDGKIFQLEVDHGETVFVNPTNVIAYTREHGDSKRAIVKLPHASTFLELPQLPGWMDHYLALVKLPSWVRRVGASIKALSSKLRNDDIALRVEGPRTILVNTNGTPLKHVFDKRELKQVAAHGYE